MHGFVDVLLLVPAKNKAAIGKSGCGDEHKCSAEQQRSRSSADEVLNCHSQISGFHKADGMTTREKRRLKSVSVDTAEPRMDADLFRKMPVVLLRERGWKSSFVV